MQINITNNEGIIIDSWSVEIELEREKEIWPQDTTKTLIAGIAKDIGYEVSQCIRKHFND